MQSSFYEKPRATLRQRYAVHLSGGSEGLLCVISTLPLKETARHACLASAERLGYKTEESGCEVTFVALEAEDTLIGPELARLIETLDPLCLVITDQAAAQTIAQAYRTTFSLETPALLLGRPMRAFVDFSMLLDTREGKVRAWNLLKTLPQR